MQFAKDSFFKTLCTRIAAINPARVMELDGTQRPGVVVLENERAEIAEKLEDVFCLSWGSLSNVEMPWTPNVLDCNIVYRSSGTAESGGVDRGRKIGAMDVELQQALRPEYTEKIDYTQSTPFDLGTRVFWGEAHYEETKQEGALLNRNVNLKVYYYPENVA